METHASSTHLGLKTTPSHSLITIPSLEETISSFSSLEEILDTNFSSWKANLSCEVIHRAPRFIYNNSKFNTNFQSSEQQGKSIKKSNVNKNVIAYSNSEFRNSVIDDLRPYTDHEYEEINLKESRSRLKYDILDYYEKYSPTAAKTLIDTLCLPRNEICKKCARFNESPIYSDRLIYSKKNLYAREILMFQFENSVYFTGLRSNDSPQASQHRDYMPVCNLAKTNASGIFYLSGPQDVFDLKSTLEPEIVTMNNEFRGIANTEIYHRQGSKFCSRISQDSNTSMRFQCREFSLRNEVKMKNSKDNEYLNVDSQTNRASLLLLEPLIFMPSFPQGKSSFSKSRISHTENLTLAKIVIAYTLAFVIVTIITFYVVYFT